MKVELSENKSPGNDFSDSPLANLLITKLTAPVYSLKTVQRRRLTDRLMEGMQRRLTLVMAPAGYGKTTLLSEWTSSIETLNWPVAWVLLDKEDSGVQFWSYFVGALRTIEPKLQFDWLDGIGMCHDAIDCRKLNPLINQIAAIPHSFSIILDDFHEIQAEIVIQTLIYLIDHMPGNMHLVIASRTTPPMPLARLRSRGQLTEILDTDLSFTREETETFLAKVMELQMTDENVTALIEITEGWIAGLQMAVLSLKGGRDIGSFLGDFSGSFHHVMDYLTEEVISQQTDEIRSFLIKTSILTKMTAALCDEVLEVKDSQEKLKYLEQSNLFILPLDEQRIWYRYHPLFQDYLRLSLERVYPDQISQLHQSACTWLENNSYPEQAIPHALACGDYEKAAADIESCILQYFLRSDLRLVLQWTERLPQDVLLKRPRLAMVKILAYVAYAQRDELTKTLIDLNSIISQAIDSESELTDNLSLRKKLLLVRAITACIQSDYERAIELSSQTLPILGAEDYHLAGMLSHFVHYAYLAQGRLDKASEMLSVALQISQAHGMDREYLSSMCALGRIYKYRGWLHEAANVFRNALADAYKKAVGLKTISFIQAGLSNIYREWNQLDLADRCIQDAQINVFGERTSFLEWNFAPDYYLIVARNCLVHEDFETAKRFVDAAKAALPKYYKIPFLAAQTKSMEVRYWIAVEDFSRVADWIAETQARLSKTDEHLSTIERITLARAYLALGRARQASDLLTPLLQRDKQIPLVEYQIEAFLIKALALYQSGEKAGAKATFLTALKLAESEGFVRIFIDAGAGLKSLLAETVNDLQTGNKGIKAPWSLISFAKMLQTQCHPAWEKKPGPFEKPKASLPTLNEPLSNRELEIIRLMAYGKNSKEISARLCISINTARTHIKNIYQKFEVHSREEAIEKATILNIL